MNKIKIEWLTDSYDCETCGPSWAEGARVTYNGNEILTLEPLAHCYASKSYDREDVYKQILNCLGYTVDD